MMRDASEHVEMGWGALWVGRMATSAIGATGANTCCFELSSSLAIRNATDLGGRHLCGGAVGRGGMPPPCGPACPPLRRAGGAGGGQISYCGGRHSEQPLEKDGMAQEV